MVTSSEMLCRYAYIFLKYVHMMQQALCITPSRKLVHQIMTAMMDMGKFTPVTTTYSIEDSVPHGTILIVIGTPGTLTDLIRKQNINSKQIKIFMVDEAENMLGQQGLGDQTLQVKKCTHPTSWGAGIGSSQVPCDY